jgi:hypothetical protein
MRKSRRDSWIQGYNAQAVVDADGGYANAEEFGKLADDVDLYVAVSSADAGERRCDFRPQQEKKTATTVTDPQLVVMLSQFLLRGLHNVTLAWELLCTAYNLKRLWAGQTIEGRNHRAPPAHSQPDIRHPAAAAPISRSLLERHEIQRRRHRDPLLDEPAAVLEAQGHDNPSGLLLGGAGRAGVRGGAGAENGKAGRRSSSCGYWNLTTVPVMVAWAGE